MKPETLIRTLTMILLFAGCTIEFKPEIMEDKELLVVSGLITDQAVSNRVVLSRSTPIGNQIISNALTGALVTVTDENGVVTTLTETSPGIYSTDSTTFRGRVGGHYALNIFAEGGNYETDFVEMKPVPQIGALYYEKVVITASTDSSRIDEGCRIYLDSYDPTGKCLFFRWGFVETWEYHIPYPVVNSKCWATERSDRILIKNTSVYNQARISKYPVIFITNRTTRLQIKYSILVNQYSITETEYNFWEKVQSVNENVGGLYDMTPMAIPGNIRCTSRPEETVLGYFSVSAVAEKRLFVEDQFLGLPHFYTYCVTDTLTGFLPEEGLNSSYWVVDDNGNEIPPWWVITTYRECGDCVTDAERIKPDYWDDF
ncbi:MAG: DUF4249 domain-containing protein [Bacteroidales bacterium]|nr:DUF4249 domain-containing protein [Bacteroidales bacterium]